MDRATLVIDRFGDTRKLIDRLAEGRRLVVSDAFWAENLESEEREWTLFIASPAIDEIGIFGGYDAIILALKDHPEIHLDAGDIVPRSTDDPTVAEVLDFLRRYPAAEAFRLKGVFLKGHFVQRAYIYPVLLDGKAEVEAACGP